MGAGVQQIGSGRYTSALSGALNYIEHMRRLEVIETYTPGVSFKASSWAAFDKSLATHDWRCSLCAPPLAKFDWYHRQ